MRSWQFTDVYVQSSACSGGPLESEGPCGAGLDYVAHDLHDGEPSFEKAEISLLRHSCDLALRKGGFSCSDLDVCVGGDLMNQLLTTHYFARDLHVPTLGVYAACATSSLAIGTASLLVQQGMAAHALAFTSSHNAAAERQFRFPNEYGVQKKETTTTTVSGAGSIVLGRTPQPIAVRAFTLGRIIDWHHLNASDMGIAMAPAALDTLHAHLAQTNSTIDDYDWILTGDLSKAGFGFLCDLLSQEGIHADSRFNDCGLMIYDVSRQPVFCGGSGCACSMCVSIAEVFSQLRAGRKKRVLILATGALLSMMAIYQKDTIPCIAHAIEYQRRDDACGS